MWWHVVEGEEALRRGIDRQLAALLQLEKRGRQRAGADARQQHLERLARRRRQRIGPRDEALCEEQPQIHELPGSELGALRDAQSHEPRRPIMTVDDDGLDDGHGLIEADSGAARQSKSRKAIKRRARWGTENWRRHARDRVRLRGMSFPITCTACTKTFTISDEIYEKKVAGRVVTIKCKSCAQGIRVDGTKGAGAGKAASEPAPAATPAAAEAALPAPAVAAAPSEPLWAVDYPDGQDREFTSSEVIAELTRGTINGATLVWRDGMAEWLEAAQVAEFAADVVKLEAQKKAEADRLEAQKKAEADRAEAKKKAAVASVKQSATATPIHTPRPPMPTETGLAGLPGAEKQSRPDAAPKPKSLATTEPAVPRAKLPSASDGGAPRAKQPSGLDLGAPRAKQPSGLDLGAPRAEQASGAELAKTRPDLPASPVVKPQAAPTATPLPFSPAVPPVAPPRMLDLPATASSPVAASSLPLNSAVATPPPVARPPLLTPPLPFDVTPPLPASVAQAVSGSPKNRPSFPPPAGSPPLSSAAPAFGVAPTHVALPTIPSAHATVDWPEAKSKTPLVIGALIVAALLLGGGIFLLGGKDQLPP